MTQNYIVDIPFEISTGNREAMPVLHINLDITNWTSDEEAAKKV